MLLASDSVRPLSVFSITIDTTAAKKGEHELVAEQQPADLEGDEHVPDLGVQVADAARERYQMGGDDLELAVGALVHAVDDDLLEAEADLVGRHYRDSPLGEAGRVKNVASDEASA